MHGRVTQTPPPAGAGTHLAYNAPLGPDAVDRLLGQVIGPRTRMIADLGCGWGELLLQALERAPGASGIGFDLHEPDIDRAKAAAAARGLQERVLLRAEDAKVWDGRADLLLSIGAYQAFGDIPTALSKLRERLAPGGRMLFGCEYWAHRPTAEQLAVTWGGVEESTCLYLPEIVETVQGSGWRILDLHDSTRTELDSFELGHLRERQQWLLDHPDHPDLPDLADHPMAAELDAEVLAWVRGHREPFGFVTLVLG